MRHPSSFSLHRIAAAAAMSTRPPFRGGRGRRSYSDRPFSVPGDSHVQSAHNTNSAFQRTTTTNNYNNNINHYSENHAQNCNSRLDDNNNNNYINNVSRGGANFRPRPPPFNRRPHQNQTARTHRPKPADFRSWEFAKHPLPSNSERFVVLSYNILADYLANGHRKLYYHIPRRFMNWEWRKSNILFELGLWSPDIMCFQEVDKFPELEEDLRVRGYSGMWKMRTGDPIDGCAVFWRTTRFKLVFEECIEFNKHGMRDNVAQICVLESLIENHNGNQSPSSSSDGPNRVVICNIHVLYNPRRGEIKLGQVRLLLERAQAVSKTWDDAPVVLCGDFNCTPKSPLYNFISEQKLDISEVERDKVSGQASAEICPPLRQYGHHFRKQLSGSIANPIMAPNSSMDRRQSDFLENQNAAESTVINLPTSRQPPSIGSSLGVTENLCNDSPKSSVLSEEVMTNTSEYVGDFSKNNGGLTKSTANLKNSQSDNTDMCTYETIPAKSADQSIMETLQDPEFSSSASSAEKVASSGLSLDKHQIRTVPITECSTWNLSSDQLSSAAYDSKTNIAVEDCRDDNNLNNCESENSGPSSESVEVHVLHPTRDLPSQSVSVEAKPAPAGVCEAGETNTSLAFNYSVIDEKLNGLSLSEIDEQAEDNADSGEDVEKFSSILHNNGDAFPSNLGDVSLEADTADENKFSYDPSLWTAMEIATATGNADSTLLEHPLKLRSTYSEVVGSSGTRDSYGEPLVTSYNSCFMGTVDYIWRSEGLQTVKVLAPISKHVMQPSGGFPTKKWGSDHIALASELAFTK